MLFVLDLDGCVYRESQVVKARWKLSHISRKKGIR